MSGVTQILVIPRGASQSKRIVTTAGVLHDFNQRLLIHRPVFAENSWAGVERAHQRSRGGWVDIALDALIQCTPRKRLKVRTLATFDIEDLNILTCFDLIGSGVSGLNIEIQHRICQRIWWPNIGFTNRWICPADIQD